MSKIQLPNIQDLVKGGIAGIADAAGNIISKFKADPTKVAEAEADIEKLRINADLESQKIAIQAEEVANETLRIELEGEKAKLADVANARDMNKEIQVSDKASWMSKNIAYCIDAFFVIAFVIMLIMIVYKTVPAENKEIFYTAFGLLGGFVGTILNFHRGTSIGSKNNGDVIRKIASNK
jgi:hypothetical protein